MKLQITIEGRVYAVDVELMEEEPPVAEEVAPFPAFVAQPAISAAAANGADPNFCRSPVNGLVIKVNAEPEQLVEAGAVVAVVEAMKMETNITASRAARIKAVHVKPRDPVKTGQVLVELEDEAAGGAGEGN